MKKPPTKNIDILVALIVLCLAPILSVVVIPSILDLAHSVDSESSFNGGDITQEGYFKADDRDRIFAFSFSSTTTKSQIKAHAREQMNTSGRLTACYYFPIGSSIPRDGLTLAKGLFRANEVINMFASGIDYAYMINGRGSSQFVDCGIYPKDDLCISH